MLKDCARAQAANPRAKAAQMLNLKLKQDFMAKYKVSNADATYRMHLAFEMFDVLSRKCQYVAHPVNLLADVVSPRTQRPKACLHNVAAATARAARDIRLVIAMPPYSLQLWRQNLLSAYA
jgi:hypothetical protein